VTTEANGPSPSPQRGWPLVLNHALRRSFDGNGVGHDQVLRILSEDWRLRSLAQQPTTHVN